MSSNQSANSNRPVYSTDSDVNCTVSTLSMSTMSQNAGIISPQALFSPPNIEKEASAAEVSLMIQGTELDSLKDGTVLSIPQGNK